MSAQTRICLPLWDFMPYTLEIDYCDPRRMLLSFAGGLDAALISDGGPMGRFSYLFPKVVKRTEAWPQNADDLKAILQENAPPKHKEGRFVGGLLGFAAFELGLRLETLTAGPFRLNGAAHWPELVLLDIDSGLVFDHHEKTAYGFAPTKNAVEALVAHYAALKPLDGPLSGLSDGPMVAETNAEVHAQKVAALVQKIHAGELFQANLAQGWGGRLKDELGPEHLLYALSHKGPAPFVLMMRFGDRAIVSNSPERFILGEGRDLSTRPIKGTRPRGTSPEADKALGEELRASEKDRAENLMIVDLMRNDLARISQAGSVNVPSLHALESYANVHHLVSTVQSQLKQGLDLADILAATLPAGSISGAPKVQAMKVIAQMEAPRGPYCGVAFLTDGNGVFDSSVLIRTLALEKQQNRWVYRCAAGGGIVADSDPEAETQETEIKISTIRSVLES